MIIFLMSLMAICCHRNSDAWQRMDAAEAVMNEFPDSALAIIESIDVSLLNGKEERARHALLRSMAFDKNYIDTTTFDVLQPAIDYYLKKGTPDEKLKTLYYQGRIYDNQGDDNKEMACYLKAADYITDAKDSYAIANLLVAQGSIFFETYKLDEHIYNNLCAAQLFSNIGKKGNQISCMARALNGCIMNSDKERADSIYVSFSSLISDNPEYKQEYMNVIMEYVVKWGDKDEIRHIIKGYAPDDDIDDSVKLNLANAYSEIGDGENALKFFNSIEDVEVKNTFQYLAIKPYVLKETGQLTEAFQSLEEFSDSLISRHMKVFWEDLLFAQNRHELELANFKEIQKKDRIIWISVCVALLLLIVVGFFYYRLRLGRAKISLQKKENERLALEKERQELAAENMQDKLEQLEFESANLKNLIATQRNISEEVKKVMRDRTEMLNTLLASEITKNKNLTESYIELRERILKDKDEFMNSTRLAFKASHPKFIEYLENQGLTEKEINYLCLYALGLSGKEVGTYINKKSHYNLSSEIRHKLGIEGPKPYLSNYIQTLMNKL